MLIVTLIVTIVTKAVFEKIEEACKILPTQHTVDEVAGANGQNRPVSAEQ